MHSRHDHLEPRRHVPHLATGLAAAVLCALALAFATPAGAIVIDDFEVGDFYVASGGGFPYSYGGEAHLIGGVRRTGFGSVDGPGHFAQLTTSAYPDVAYVAYSSGGSATFNLIYEGDGALDADLTVGGHDRIEVVTGNGPDTGSVGLAVTTGSGGSYLLSQPLDGSNLYVFRFADLVAFAGALDFADVDRIDLAFGGSGSVVEIAEVRTALPEPAPLALAVLAAAALAARRRTRA
jgi:hypothetical protein